MVVVDGSDDEGLSCTGGCSGSGGSGCCCGCSCGCMC